MTSNILNIKNVSKFFTHNNKKVEIFKNINFSLKKGELVALTGPSGSGKSTLLHLISLLEKPTNGKILFFNQDINNLNKNDINRLRRFKMSLIFQNNNLISDLNVIENVMLPLLIRDEDPKKSYEKSKKILAKVQLSNRYDYFPNDLCSSRRAF